MMWMGGSLKRMCAGAAGTCCLPLGEEARVAGGTEGLCRMHASMSDVGADSGVLRPERVGISGVCEGDCVRNGEVSPSP